MSFSFKFINQQHISTASLGLNQILQTPEIQYSKAKKLQPFQTKLY